MATRYSLRFEGGEREGEEIPVEASGVTVGRRPGQTLQILDASVSGKHAEITLDEHGVLLRDVGSTNGTRVRGERVIEKRLGHGDRIAFGNVFVTFVDSLATETLALRPDAPAADPAIERVSSKALARAGERSRWGLVVLAVLAVAGAAGWFLVRRSGGPLATRTARAAASPAGNLLVEDYSFESEGESWTRADDSPAIFLKGADARFSGDVGLSCELDPGAWAVTRSPELHTTADQQYTARAMVRSSGGARVRVGLEFSPAPETTDLAPAPVSVWSAPSAASHAQAGAGGAGTASHARAGASGAGAASHTSVGANGEGAASREAAASEERAASQEAAPSEEFAAAEVSSAPPPGYTMVRVLIAAWCDDGAGRADADDVTLMASAAPAIASPTATPREFTVGERKLVAIGDPVGVATLSDLARPILTDIHFEHAGPSRRFDSLAFRLREDPAAKERVELAPDAAPGTATGPCVLVLHCEPALLRGSTADAHAAEPIATVGEDGRQAHALDFRRERATDLLLGSGRGLVRIGFSAPATVRGRAEANGARIEVELPPNDCSARIQLDFQRERTEAGNVAHAARTAEKKKELGECLRQWSLLLDTYPFEDALVREAEASRARLIHEGLESLRAVELEVEDARFFRLAALFEQSRAKARAIAALYAPSEVDERARTLADSIDTELAELDRGKSARERGRLEAIARALRARKAEGLAAVVEEYLHTRLEDAR